MLSYETILAIQILYVLHRSGTRGAGMAEILLSTGLDSGELTAAVRRLKIDGWLVCVKGDWNKKALAPRTLTRTLYELTITMEGGVRQGEHRREDCWRHWSPLAERQVPRAVQTDRELARLITDKLKGITIEDLITQVEPKRNVPMTETKN